KRGELALRSAKTEKSIFCKAKKGFWYLQHPTTRSAQANLATPTNTKSLSRSEGLFCFKRGELALRSAKTEKSIFCKAKGEVSFILYTL
ncbi:MAG TPA: hypothetical protein PLQ93_08385, partial [Bacteroidia bacterium]|nr:hypothetical protein [Bacteroidia bacterium]